MSKTGSKLIWKLSGGVLGLLALLAILIAANVVLRAMPLRQDLTEARLFTLSEGTRHILRNLDAPVVLKFFFSRSAPQTPPPLKNFAQQVEDLLHEYRLAAGGKVSVEIYDPKPDSEAEEWAERYGVSGQNSGMMEPALFCGLTAVKGDIYETMPFLDPRQEELLEYNITRLIARAANPKKTAVGVMSSLPVMGVRAFPYAMPGQPQPKNLPPWVALQDLGKDYDTRQVPVTAEQIDDDINVMIVIHPKNLSAKTLYALDQFVLRGGRLLAFVDPLCLAEAMNPDLAAPPARPFSELTKLTEAWGVKYEPDKVVADLEAATRVRRNDNAIDDSPVFLSLRQDNIDGQDVITAPLEGLIMPGAGAFAGSGPAGLTISALLASSPQAQLINPMTAQLGSEAIRRDFQAALKKMSLAVRLQGKFKTAFPEGAPQETAAAEDKEQKKDEPKPPAPPLKESAAPTTVILVGDVDLLYDAFAVQELNLFGVRAYQPVNDNINFFINAVDNLAGSAELARVRARGQFERPFDRVIALQRQAQEKWLRQERALQKELAATQERLAALQSQKDKNQKFILSPEQEEEIKHFRAEQMKTQRALKQVRKNLREGIERLGAIVKAINILLVPAGVAAAGLIFAWYRRARTKNA